MAFQLPSGLLSAASGGQSPQFMLPSGLIQPGMQPENRWPTREQFTQNAIGGFQDNAGGLDLSGLDWQNPNDNPIEQFLNDDQPGQPYFKVGARIEFDPETGQLVSIPLANQYDELYQPGGNNEYYTGHQIGGGEMGQFAPADIKDVPGYSPGETFRTDDAVYYYHNDPAQWQPVDPGQPGYTRQGTDSRYVDQYVQGKIPYDFDSEIPAQAMTDIVSQAFNPTINDFISYLNANLAPEQLSAAFESGFDPLEMSYKMHDWDIVKELIGKNGAGRVPTKMMGDMTDWAGGLYDAAGLTFEEPTGSQFRLPSGLL